LGLSAMGTGVVVIGLIYDLIFAGLPYQDPTHKMQIQWEFHHSVANVFYLIGVCIFFIGLIAAPIIWKSNRRKM